MRAWMGREQVDVPILAICLRLMQNRVKVGLCTSKFPCFLSVDTRTGLKSGTFFQIFKFRNVSLPPTVFRFCTFLTRPWIQKWLVPTDLFMVFLKIFHCAAKNLENVLRKFRTKNNHSRFGDTPVIWNQIWIIFMPLVGFKGNFTVLPKFPAHYFLCTLKISQVWPTLGLKFGHSQVLFDPDQWRIQDFPGASTTKGAPTYYLTISFTKTAWKWRNFGRGRISCTHSPTYRSANAWQPSPWRTVKNRVVFFQGQKLTATLFSATPIYIT